MGGHWSILSRKEQRQTDKRVHDRWDKADPRAVTFRAEQLHNSDNGNIHNSDNNNDNIIDTSVNLNKKPIRYAVIDCPE